MEGREVEKWRWREGRHIDQIHPLAAHHTWGERERERERERVVWEITLELFAFENVNKKNFILREIRRSNS